MQIVRLTKIFADRLTEGIGSQGAGRNDHRAFGNFRHFTLNDGDIGVISDLFRNHGSKAHTVHRKAAARFHAGSFGTFHNDTAAAAQLFLQKANCIFQPVTPQGIGANQFCKVLRMMCRAFLMGAHFIEFYFNTPLGQLPCSFTAGKSGAYDFYFHFCASLLFLAVVFFAAGFLAVLFFAVLFLVAVFLVVFFAGFFSAAGSPAGSPSVPSVAVFFL